MTSDASLWHQVHPDENGLVPCVTQDLRTRAVLMVAWVSEAALEATIQNGYATYFSRSRNELWEKGATSGNRQRIVHIRLDCDGDTLLYLVEAGLPACHTGTDTCFHWRWGGPVWLSDPVELQDETESHKVVDSLDTVLDARLRAPTPAEKPSYTRALLEGGLAKQSEKIREETEELLVALASETEERVVSESADVLYHLAVALKARKVSFKQVLAELDRRLGTSGVEEKARRKPQNQG
jgi:phosphoribosyl-ATP pyrophosphohydrolase/phosphoribosyl-AMP cyclohydrolase